jgi:hypothetical protein
MMMYHTQSQARPGEESQKPPCMKNLMKVETNGVCNIASGRKASLPTRIGNWLNFMYVCLWECMYIYVIHDHSRV